MPASTALGWGDWSLGDMADAVRRAAEVLGSGLAPRSVVVTPPPVVGDLPQVVVTVEDQHTLFRLRADVRRGDEPAHFLGDRSAAAWRAEVNDIELTVQLEEGEEPW